jgi:hypothetical protein
MSEEGNKFMSELEQAKGMKDMGVMGFRIFNGAVEEGASVDQAVMIVAAFFTGMFTAGKEPSTDDD